MINLGKKPKFIRFFINLNADLYQWVIQKIKNVFHYSLLSPRYELFYDKDDMDNKTTALIAPIYYMFDHVILDSIGSEGDILIDIIKKFQLNINKQATKKISKSKQKVFLRGKQLNYFLVIYVPSTIKW